MKWTKSITEEQGRTEKLKWGGGETEGERANIEKKTSFCEILSKISKRGGKAPPPLYAYADGESNQ